MKEEEKDILEKDAVTMDELPMEVVIPDEPEKMEAVKAETPEEEEHRKSPRKHRKDAAKVKPSRLLASLLNDEDDDEATIQQWKDVINQVSIDGQWFRKQIGLLMLIVCGVILYITNRYQAQQEIIEEEQLRTELQDWKFRSLTRNSELTFYTRQSQIQDRLHAFGDTTLLPSNEAPFKIELKKDK